MNIFPVPFFTKFGPFVRLYRFFEDIPLKYISHILCGYSTLYKDYYTETPGLHTLLGPLIRCLNQRAAPTGLEWPRSPKLYLQIAG